MYLHSSRELSQNIENKDLIGTQKVKKVPK